MTTGALLGRRPIQSSSINRRLSCAERVHLFHAVQMLPPFGCYESATIGRYVLEYLDTSTLSVERSIILLFSRFGRVLNLNDSLLICTRFEIYCYG